jgi:FAD/FMN-containing dehydrogenase
MSKRCPGREPGFSPQDVAALAAVTTGTVLFGGCNHVAADKRLRDGGPAIAVEAVDVADVVAAVRFATDFRLPLTVCSPGHDPGTQVTGGLLLTTARMNRLHIDRVSRTVIAEAGALWPTVVRRAAEVGLAPLVPADREACVVGRTYGWTAGHVRAIEYVTPGGQLRRVTDVSDPRLFRRLCGSEPDDVVIGVITAMEFALFR